VKGVPPNDGEKDGQTMTCTPGVNVTIRKMAPCNYRDWRYQYLYINLT